MNPRGLFVAGAALAALVLFTRRAEAAPSDQVNPSPIFYPPDFGAGPGYSSGDPMQEIDNAQAVGGDLVSAFLYAIRMCETGRPDDYGVFYGGSRFVDFSNHPVLTGEKKGVPLSDSMCRNAGMAPGCVSTAAGAYQINLPTWRDLTERWGYPMLPDFSPASQDAAAIRILEHDGALDYLNAGDVVGALNVASRRWASLPGSRAGQRPKSTTQFFAYFDNALASQA